MLDVVEIALKLEKIVFLRLDGQLAQKQREKVIRDFYNRDDSRVLLISTKAGGLGLNLTCASYVFILDPWWNPAVEMQAIDRVHRLGQKKTVIAKRFIVADSVEEKILALQVPNDFDIVGCIVSADTLLRKRNRNSSFLHLLNTRTSPTVSKTLLPPPTS